MAKKIAVLMTDMVEDIEFTNPKEVLEAEGHEVEVVTPDGSAAEGKNGGTFEADKSVDDAKPEDYDGVLVPGGFSPDVLRGDEKNAAFAKYFLENDKPTFSICHGPQFLIDTGLLEGRNLTSVKNVSTDLKNAGVKYHDESVVVCSNLVTSRTPDDLDDFNNAIKEQLK